MSDETDTTAAAAPAAPGKSKILPLLLVVNTLLIAGVLIFVMKRPAAHATPEVKAEGEHGATHEGGEKVEGAAAGALDPGNVGPTLRFDNFTVQLKSNDIDRYAHFSIEIEVGDELGKTVVEKRVPQVRDGVLAYVSDRTPEELRGSEGLRQMKEALIKRLDEIVPGHRVRALYITDFIIQ